MTMNRNAQSRTDLYDVLKQHESAGERTRLRITAACIDVLATKGLDGTTYQAVGDRCGLPKAHIAYYFSNRSALIMGAMEAVAATAQQLTVECLKNTGNDPYANIEGIARAAFAWAERFPTHVPVLIAFQSIAQLNADARRLNRQIRIMGVRRILAAIDSIPELAKTPHSDRVTAAQEIQFLILGSIMWFLPAAKARQRKLEERTIASCLKVLSRFESGKQIASKR